MDLTLDLSLATELRSGSQIARVISEDWVTRQLPCLNCDAASLRHSTPNSPALDFECPSCSAGFELKSRKDAIGAKVADGAYDTLVLRLSSLSPPSFLLMRYDIELAKVRDLFAIPSGLLSPIAVERRPPLPPTARRAGWVGSNISLGNLPEGALIPIVRDGTIRSIESVRMDWRRFHAITKMTPSSRGWSSDVLGCVRRIPVGYFSLGDVYRFEQELSRIHPENRNVRPKIRQQLQVLVAAGYLQRVSPGLYRRVWSTSHPTAAEGSALHLPPAARVDRV